MSGSATQDAFVVEHEDNDTLPDRDHSLEVASVDMAFEEPSESAYIVEHHDEPGVLLSEVEDDIRSSVASDANGVVDIPSDKSVERSSPPLKPKPGVSSPLAQAIPGIVEEAMDASHGQIRYSSDEAHSLDLGSEARSGTGKDYDAETAENEVPPYEDYDGPEIEHLDEENDVDINIEHADESGSLL